MTVFKISRRYGLLWAVIVGLGWFAAHAAETTTTWVRYFPERMAAPADESGWAELAKVFPNRVKRVPAADTVPLQPPPATRTEIRPGLDYVRVRLLANDLGTIEEALAQPRLIIDLRYVRSELDDALRLGALLARRPFALAANTASPEPRRLRDASQVTICLINRATAGPLEAVLDALQTSGDVLLVGTQSAGDTGSFVPADNAPTWSVIADDYRRANGTSLLDVGVTPGLFVETVSHIEDAAYLAFDAGRPMPELLDATVEKTRFDEARLLQRFAETRPGNGIHGTTAPVPASPPPTESSSEDEDREKESPQKTAPAAEGPAPFDRSLQRAVSVLVTHEIFHAKKSAGP